MVDQGISKASYKLVDANPSSSMVIRDLTPNITIFSTPFLRGGLIKIGGRATLVKLKTGNLAVFNPVSLTPEVKQKVSSILAQHPEGQVKYLIAPDYEHHLFISPWAKEYKDVSVIGPEGLPEKREGDEATKGVKFSHVFTPGNKLGLKITPEFDDEFDYEYVDSHQNKELVFFHKPSRTCIEADLLFNLPATEQFSKSGQDAESGILTKIFGLLMNTRGDMRWQKRLLWYGVGSKDRKALAESAKRIAAWGDYDRLIPCHGDVIERGGSRILNEALAWYRQIE